MANSLVYNTLSSLLTECIQHFSANCHSVSSESILKYLQTIENHLQYVEPIAKDFIGKYASNYDVVPGLEVNGYRSILAVLESLLLIIISTLRTVSAECGKTFFQGNFYVDKLHIYSDILHQLRALLYYAQMLIGLTPNGELFVDEKASEPFMHDCEIMAKACFYGSMHGFQYCGGMKPVVQSLATFAASYNDVHQPAGTWATFKSAINSSRYVVSPELRGEQLEKVYNGGDIQFFKNFWGLHEQGIVKAIPNLVGASVQVNRTFEIEPKAFDLPSVVENKNVRISFTSSLGLTKTVNGRLISFVLREGQESPASPSKPDTGFDKSRVRFKTIKAKPKSKNLIFFCHGGGFVALTSKSYELVLRQWSKELECPIFSIDYSLAPDAPFPEAFEECFYAYAWAINNAEYLGTTAENIVFAGDSAGGNLVLSVAMRAAMYGIKLPNSIVSMYPACIVRYSASPARLLSIMDPLLPLGVLSGCLGAYSGVKTKKIKRRTSKDWDASLRPMSPSRQPVSVKLLSSFVKDVGETFNRITNNATSTKRKPEDKTWWDEEFEVVSPDEISKTISDQSIDQSRDEEKHRNSSAMSIDGINNNSAGADPDTTSEKTPTSSSHMQDDDPGETIQRGGRSSLQTGTKFKLKLPHSFRPLKSKFCGDNFQMHHSPVVRNAFISPALASEDLLRKLPYVDIVGCEFDPLLDDSVILAKRLQSLGKSYQFHLIRGLPHGFLNLQVSNEAKEAAKSCLERIKAGLERTTPL
ncbi:hormone-sensitive lipase-like [Clavelina lepadiformis]|uniref:hormone-sensitive lipase-like n=1 Tax=Clavelina lepadiformis TaxID=159417 RepID=UPI004041F68A